MNTRTAQFGISIWLVPLAVAACQSSPPEGERIGRVAEPITLENCPDTIACPLPPFPDDCSGTWWNTAYDPSTPNEDCPAKDPYLTCDPVILGRCNSTYSDICKYRGCPGYIVLNMSDWTIQQNDRFIACAQAGLLDNQCDTIVVGSPSNHVPDPDPGTTGSVTYRELCQLNACGCPTVFDDTGGEATCGCAPTQGIDVELAIGIRL
ncbi:hypothetical protein LZC95_30025 [Pendulispora brunnea]|uniref:Uncharacterized protein n=1 Tax=Pendulispora brunnea TaxID=2905690 RepID=A0ABZ2JW24_9BACT